MYVKDLQVLSDYLIVTFVLRVRGGVTGVVESVLLVPEESANNENAGAAQVNNSRLIY